MIKAVIIDDESALININRILLNDNFPKIELVGEADSVDSGIEHKPRHCSA